MVVDDQGENQEVNRAEHRLKPREAAKGVGSRLRFVVHV
jgi:hypothetical protein